jgi:hypothetical protein
MRAACHGFLMADAGFGDQLEHVAFGQQRRLDDQRAGNLDRIVDQQKDQVMRGSGVLGQALGQRDADRHFHVAGEAAQDLAHQFALALVQAGALDAVERRDGEVNLLAAGARLRVHRQLGQTAHVTHIVCGEPHGAPQCFCNIQPLLRPFLVELLPVRPLTAD